MCDDVAVPFRLSDPRTCTIITLHLKDKKKAATVSCVVVKSPGVPSIAFCSPASQFCWWEGGNSSLKNYRKNCSTFCVLRIEKVNSFDRGRTTSLRKRRRRRRQWRLLFNWRTECRSLKAKETKPWHQRPTNQTISSLFFPPFSLCARRVHELFRVLTSSFSCNWSVLRHPVGAATTKGGCCV